MRELAGLRIRQRNIERLGCIKGCLEYLGRDVSFPWLYGGTGHAFIISLDPGVDVSSPDSWNHQPQYDLGRNLGYLVDGFSAWKPDAGDAFPSKQREAWDFVRSNIDRGVPCFGFELKAFYGGYWVIYGYEDAPDNGGYYYSGWEEGGPLPWDKLGDQFIPLLEVRSVALCPPAPPAEIVKAGVAFALRHAEGPPDLMINEAKAGPAAWAYWADALDRGEAKRDHHTYNLGVWLECREMAVAFLREAKQALHGCCDDLFDAAAGHYTSVCEGLRALRELHPEREKPDFGSDAGFASPQAAEMVRQVGDTDGKGLDCLKGLLDRLLQEA